MHRRKELASKRCVKTFAAIAVVLGMLLACMLISPKYAQAASYDLSGEKVGWVVGTGDQGSQVQFSTDGGEHWRNYTDGMTLDYGTQVKVKLSWNVPNDVKVQQGTTFTYDLPQGIAFENGATYPMYDSTGKQRGTFTVQGNKVVATYTDTTDASSGINAYVTIDGKITRSADNNGNGGKRDWNFPGIGKVETTINPERGLDIHKNGAVNTGETDADGNSVYYYVLNVGSTGPNTNVTITDTMGRLLTLVPGSFELFTDAGLTTKYDKSDWTATPNTGGDGFTLTIPSMGDGEKLYVKYKVKVNRQQVIKACKDSADATAQCENGNLNVTDNKVTIKSNESKEKTDHKGLVFKSKWTVSKRGSTDADQKNINWSIDLIPGDDSNTTNTTIKDVLGNGMDEPAGDVTIECYGKDNKYWPVQKTVKIKWADLVNGTAILPEGYGRYVITYTTPIHSADSTTQTTYTNTVDGKDGDGNDFNGTGTVTIDRTEGDIAKRTLSGASVTSPIQWETTFTAKKNLDGATITDTVDWNCSGKNADGSDKCTATGDWQTLKHDVKVYTDAAHTNVYPASNYQIEYAKDNKSFTLTVTRGLAKGGHTLRRVFHHGEEQSPEHDLQHGHLRQIHEDRDAHRHERQYGQRRGLGVRRRQRQIRLDAERARCSIRREGRGHHRHIARQHGIHSGQHDGEEPVRNDARRSERDLPPIERWAGHPGLHLQEPERGADRSETRRRKGPDRLSDTSEGRQGICREQRVQEQRRDQRRWRGPEPGSGQPMDQSAAAGE